MKPLRILSVIEAEFITGAAKPLYEFGRRTLQGPISGEAVEQIIAVYRRNQEPENSFVQAARSAGLRVEVLEEAGRFDRRVPGRMRDLVARVDPDIFETNNIKSALFARLSGVWNDRPWVAFHHGFTAEDAKMRLYNLTARWSLKRAHRVVTVCNPFRDQLVSQGVPAERIYVQHNPVLPFVPPADEELEAIRVRIGAAAGEPILVAIGRLSLEKGHSDLLAAIAELQNQGVPAHLAIAGDGPERANLEEQVRALQLSNRVTFLGLVRDVRPLYSLATAMVLPSHSEGSPNVLLEAMAASCPTVATKVGGIPEMVRHEETALLVPSKDPAAMASALKRVIEDRPLRERLAQNSFERASTVYTVETYAEERVRFSRALRNR